MESTGRDWERIRQLMPHFVKLLESSDLIDHLLSERLVSDDEYDEFARTNETKRYSRRLALNLIRHGTPERFEKFLRALKKLGEVGGLSELLPGAPVGEPDGASSSQATQSIQEHLVTPHRPSIVHVVHGTEMPDLDRPFSDHPNKPGYFYGRDEMVTSICKTLLHGPERGVEIVGISGMGKSTLAQAICYKYLELVAGQPSYHCLKFHSPAECTYANVLESFLEVLGVKEEGSSSEKLEKVCKSRLKSIPQKSILLFDGCEHVTSDELDRFITFFLTESGCLKFLMTSQRPLVKFGQIQALIKTERLGELDADSSLAVLTSTSAMEDASSLKEHPSIPNIVKQCYGLPLALVLARGLLTSVGIAPEELEAKLSESSQSRLQRLSSDDGQASKERSVLKSFSCMLECLKAHNRGAFDAAICLSFFSIFTEDAVDYDISSLLFRESQSEKRKVARQLRLAVVSMIGEPIKRIRISCKEERRYFAIHSLLRDCLQGVLDFQSLHEQLLLPTREGFMQYMARVLTEIVVLANDLSGPVDDILTVEKENIKFLLERLAEKDWTDCLSSDVINDLTFAMKGDIAGNVFALTASHRVRTSAYRALLSASDSRDGNQAGLHLQLGKILLGLGKIESSKSEVEKAYETLKSSATEETASCLETLGSVLSRAGRRNADKAKQIFSECIALAQKLESEDTTRKAAQRRLASVYKKLGEVLAGAGELDEAARQFEKALEWFKRADWVSGGILFNVSLLQRQGSLLHKQNSLVEGIEEIEEIEKVFEAEEALEDARRLCEAHGLEDHPIYAKSLYYLGRLYSSNRSILKDLRKAFELYSTAQSLQEKFDPDHPDLAQTYIGKGRVQAELGCYMKSGEGKEKLKSSVELYRKAEEILKKKETLLTEEFAEFNMTEVELLGSKAFAYQHLGEEYWRKEVDCLEKKREILEKGDIDDGKLKTCYNDLGHVYKRLGNERESGKFFALARRREVGPKRNRKSGSRRRHEKKRREEAAKLSN